MVNGLRVIFFGTPAFAVPTLDALHRSAHTVVAVVTQPDRPRGRGHRLTPSPVKARALELGLPVHQPERLRDPEWLAAVRDLSTDIGVVAAYGKILRQELLDTPRLGMVNVHASLLPRWRGAAPIHRAVIAGDRETGVTIMRMVQALDAGPMIDREATPIGPGETSAALEARLAEIGGPLLVKTLDRLAAGSVAEEPQDEALVTYAHRLERSERRVDWAQPASVIHNLIRGLQPWPLVAGVLAGTRVLLLGSQVASEAQAEAAPGTIVGADETGLMVAAAPGVVRLLRLRPEGRAAMSAREFLNGHRVRPGDRLEPLPDDS